MICVEPAGRLSRRQKKRVAEELLERGCGLFSYQEYSNGAVSRFFSGRCAP